MSVIALTAVCAALFFGLACSDDDNDAGGGDGANERDDFIQDAEDRIADLRAELEEIRDDLASSDAGREIEEQADNLEGRIQDAEAELDDIRAANEDEWQDLRAAFDAAIGEAGALIGDLGAELGLD